MSTNLIQKLRELQGVIAKGGITRLPDSETLRQAADAMVRLGAQLRAAEVIIDGMDRRGVNLAQAMFSLQEQAADVQGERAANAILTGEVEGLRADIAHKDAYAEQLGRELAKAGAELDAYKEGSEQAFGAVVEQKQAAEARCSAMQETIFAQSSIIARQRNELDALEAAAMAGAEALQYLGGTLHAQRLRDAARALHA
jgi:hypothetical protein